VDFRVAFLSDIEHRTEANEWERAIKERLPKNKGFHWEELRWEGYSWRRSWSRQQLARGRTTALGDWADVILGFGSRSAWDRMLAWPEMARWRKEGKAILWLHTAPVDDPMEEMHSPDVEVIRREVWSRIDPLIGSLSSLAEQSLGRRKKRAHEEKLRAELKADQDELSRLTREWWYSYRAKRHPRNPFKIEAELMASVREEKARGPGTTLADPSWSAAIKKFKEELQQKKAQWEAKHQQKEAQWEAQWEAERQQKEAQWEAEHQKEEAQRWHNIELTCRSETTVGPVSQTDNAGDIYLVRITGSELSRATRGADERERIPDREALVTDSVSCAVYSPPQWEGGTTELVQICVYLKEDLNTVETESLAVDPMARRLRAQVLGVDLSRNTRLSITLSLDPPCDISPSLASVIWRGEAISVSFAVKILPVLRRVRALGTVEIRLDRSAAPIGVLHFRVELVPQGTRTESVTRPLGEVARLTESVFVSYASEDRSEVLRRVQGLKALGIQFFQDILNLAPGQRWAQELWRLIDQSDVFLLCWSSAARKSEWVRKEYLQANTTSSRSSDKRPHIAILPLEGPPPPEPPPELAHLHFSDDLLYAIKVESDLSAEARTQSND
jgi:TIR domain